MKAVTFDHYGSAERLRVVDVPTPAIGDHDVLVAVRAAAINPLDWHVMTGLPYVARAQFGVRGPKVTRIGVDLAGRVDAIGSRVTRWSPGDEVFGFTDGETPDQAESELGACAEYVAVPEDSVVSKPETVTFEQAAAVPAAGLTALQGLRDLGRIEAGHHVLINGASGGVGTFAVQLGKWFGAEVTGVCSTRNVELVRSIGADHVIDYTRDDFTVGEPTFDVMLDNVGNRSLRACRRRLAPEATYVASFGRPEKRWVGPMVQLVAMVVMNRFVRQRLVTWVAKPNREDLLVLRSLLEAGSVTPVIDRTYPLADVSDAMAHLDAGHARGKIVITI